MRLAVFVTALLATTPTFAVDAVTYKGMLGGLEILAELVSPDQGHLVGRYSYLTKGGDIPLNVMDGANGAIRMAEEAPCTEFTCVQDSNGDVTDTPVGATWTLTSSRDGSTLTGIWQATGKGGKELPVTLERIGKRVLPAQVELTPSGIYESIMVLTYGDGAVFAPHTAPYEFAKQDVKMEAGAEESLEGSTFRYVTDPRSKFAFPRVLELSDGSSTQIVNEALERRHTLLNYYAFDCMAQVYAGFGANQYTIVMGPGTLGGWDEESVVLTYLSPTLTNWVESGSTFCTGAHPNNHSDTYILGVKTGEPFALANVLKNWIATNNINDYGAEVDQDAAIETPTDYYWAAGQPLVDYAIAHRAKSDDAEYEAACAVGELIPSSLAFRFLPGDRVLFTMEGLPHVAFACSEDLVTVKLSDIPQFLAPTADFYFPTLAK